MTPLQVIRGTITAASIAAFSLAASADEGMWTFHNPRRAVRAWGDVRLVFQPESDIAFLGGDTDNFVYPRYDLDVAFLRVYDAGKPLASPYHLRLAAKGVADGGSPGQGLRRARIAR